MYSYVRIISYSIHRTLIKVNFPTYKSLKLYKEKLLTKDFLNILISSKVFSALRRYLLGGLKENWVGY